MNLTADKMKALPDFFQGITDPRRAQARVHRIETVLSIAAAAILCGARGFSGIYDWAMALSPRARIRFQCRFKKGRYLVPCASTFREVLVRVDPQELECALQSWNEQYGMLDESLAIDGKTMCNAVDEEGHRIHIMSAVGHNSKQCYSQKKLENCQSMEVMS